VVGRTADGWKGDKSSCERRERGVSVFGHRIPGRWRLGLVLLGAGLGFPGAAALLGPGRSQEPNLCGRKWHGARIAPDGSKFCGKVRGAC